MDAITDEHGQIIDRLSFDAWGERRGDDWRGGDPTMGTPLTFDTQTGFTGHEMLDQLGLIHMGGRVYDPVVSRFMSADLFVQLPHSPQSYNRYSYVFNNPVRYVDPSGYQTLLEQHDKPEEVYVTGTRDTWFMDMGQEMLFASLLSMQEGQTQIVYVESENTHYSITMDDSQAFQQNLEDFFAHMAPRTPLDVAQQVVDSAGFWDRFTLRYHTAKRTLQIAEWACKRGCNNWGGVSAAEAKMYADYLVAVGGVGGVRMGKGVAKSGEAATDFFAGTRYTEKVLGQMKRGDHHAFPESVKAFQESGQLSKIIGRDGVARDMLKIPGEYRGKEGFFEFIKEADGAINHRHFRANP